MLCKSSWINLDGLMGTNEKRTEEKGGTLSKLKINPHYFYFFFLFLLITSAECFQTSLTMQYVGGSLWLSFFYYFNNNNKKKTKLCTHLIYFHNLYKTECGKIVLFCFNLKTINVHVDKLFLFKITWNTVRMDYINYCLLTVTN